MERNTADARRHSVRGHRAIYYREDRAGRRRYEISYTDTTGRRRWKVIGGSLKEAVAALEDVRSRMRRGERVAPSRVTLKEYADSWLAQQTQLRPRTIEKYAGAIELHIGPLLGR